MLWNVLARANDAIWVVGDNGTLLKCSESSKACSRVGAGTSADLYDLWISSSDVVYVVGTAGTVTTCKPGQGSCTSAQLATTRDLNIIQGRAAAGGSSIWIAGDGGTILQYDGVAWKTMTSNTTANLRAVWGSSPTNIFAVGDGGTVLHYTP